MKDNKVLISELVFDAQGLIPAVITDYATKDILMVAYMSRESILQTLALQEVVCYSRSRKQLWHKGKTSGNILQVKQINVDCDQDCLQVEVEIQGDRVVCHTGSRSCFFRILE